MNSRNLLIQRIMTLAASAAMMAYGMMRQEPSLVLKKAVRICLECIGIG